MDKNNRHNFPTTACSQYFFSQLHMVRWRPLAKFRAWVAAVLRGQEGRVISATKKNEEEKKSRPPFHPLARVCQPRRYPSARVIRSRIRFSPYDLPPLPRAPRSHRLCPHREALSTAAAPVHLLYPIAKPYQPPLPPSLPPSPPPHGRPHRFRRQRRAPGGGGQGDETPSFPGLSEIR
jgi:hypothetical protein